MMQRLAPLPLFLAALLAGCGRAGDSGPIDVSVIGPAIDATRRLPSPDRAPLDPPVAILAGATAQGLIRFDAGGQIVPGLAARWIVSETGRSLIFRLPDAPSSARPAIDAEMVVRRLRAAMAPASRNPLKPLLGAIAEIDAVTPQVIDVELNAPRPNLLELFAQPALTIATARGVGGGPFDIAARARGVVVLREKPDPDADADSRPPPNIVRLRGEAAGRAVSRFLAGRTQLVLGGDFDSLPITAAAQTLPRGALHFDPAKGLFGLAFTATKKGLAADPRARRALAMAIDRDRVGRLLGAPGWTPTATIVPAGTPEIAEPAAPDWSGHPQAARQEEAQQLIASVRKTVSSPSSLRIAMPDGPGARLLFAAIAADWRAIGVSAIAVPRDADADLHLIDEVAPGESAAFYLRRFTCGRGFTCAPAIDAVLDAARTTPSLAERATLLSRADALIAANVPFIALGPPLRWSLVAPDLDLYRDSPWAIHPLNELRTPPKR